MRHEPTDAERVLWQRLRHLNVAGSHFRRQATIGPYFADFACHASRLDGVMETIAAAVRAGPPPPTPPRHASHGGRGAESTGADQSKRPGTRGAETP
jgi:hypothetical protein